MAKLTPVGSRKRKIEEAMRGKTSKPKKRIKKQKNYHSSSEEEDGGFAPVNLQDSEEEMALPAQKPAKQSRAAPQQDGSRQKQADAEQASSGAEEESQSEEQEEVESEQQATVSQLKSASGSDSSSDSDSEDDGQSATGMKKRSKRNDPEAFATSMSKILNTKLSSTQKKDPVLSRSITAAKSRQEQADQKLEAKARARLRAEKQLAMQKGRTTDVLGVERGIAGEVAEKEKQLRKIATRGVIQLFNAFRGAYEKAEQARKDEHAKGTIGFGERDRKVGEVGKEEFLERIGGKKSAVK